MPCLPCMQLNPEVAALNDCYPVSKDLVKSGPDYLPLSQDTSKLTYYASNKPSSLGKIGDELEKRVVREARGSSGGYPKSRASLLISLVILYRLLTECKRDIGLFARQTMRMISAALDTKVYQREGPDLEVCARAGTCFSAFATFTDGAAIGVDDALTEAYLTVLTKFARLATFRGKSAGATEKGVDDTEEQSRTRLIGIAALAAAAGSDAVFGSNVEFPRQARTIVWALLGILNEAPLGDLKHEVDLLAAQGSNPENLSRYVRDLTRKPVLDRRAPSIHQHVPGEKGPTSTDVYSAALQCLHDLVGECQIGQANTVMSTVIDFLDRTGWQDVERACFLAERLTSAMLLQSRYAVPTSLVELLVNMPDDVPPTAKHMSVIAMVTTILSSNISLVGLAVSDILASLLGVIVRRVAVNQRDTLLPALVSCVASLGTHIYYADQINDIVEEINMQMSSLPATSRSRSETLRVLIYCILGVMKTADIGDAAEEARGSMSPTLDRLDKGKGPLLDNPTTETRPGSRGRRNPIAPEVWQETLPMLCEASYPVRAAYSEALIFYLKTEIRRDRNASRNEPNIARFCNAVYGALYTLAMSSRLGVSEFLPSIPASPRDTPPPASTPVRPSTPKQRPPPRTNNMSSGRGSIERSASPQSGGDGLSPRKTIRSARRVSLPLNKLDSDLQLPAIDYVATPYDYSAIIRITLELQAAVPIPALLNGAPMLLALDRDAASELIRRPGDSKTGAWVLERKRAIRETVVFAWLHISESWRVNEVTELARNALHHLSEPLIVPDYIPPFSNGVLPASLPPPSEPVAFYREVKEGETTSASQPILSQPVIVNSFAASRDVQRASQQDEEWIRDKFSSPWTVETAIQQAVERFSTAKENPEEGTTGAALMSVSNRSSQSFERPEARIVDVGDLRDALDGRLSSYGEGSGFAESLISTSTESYGTGNGLPIPGTSPGRTLGKSTSMGSMGSQSTVRSPPRVKPDGKEILKEIFAKDKKRTTHSHAGSLSPPSGTVGLPATRPIAAGPEA